MDISTLLPLLLAGSGRGNGDATMLTNLLLHRNADPSELIKSSGASPEVAAALSSAISKSRAKELGLKPILGFVNDEILGKLTRWFA